jgi:hypothetical protein
MKRAFLALAAALCGVARAETILPTADGTTWKYQMTQEFGIGVRPSAGQNVKIDPDGKVRLPTLIKVTGMEKIDGVEAHKFEWKRQGGVLKVQFLEVNDQGMFELARGNDRGDKLKYDRPQQLLSFPLKVGKQWENHGEAGGQKIDETYEVVAQEPVQVPAGKFNAYHVHVVGRQPFRSIVDRWYVPNVGAIKDVTEVEGSSGLMKTRLSFELMELPTVPEKSETTMATPGQASTSEVTGPGPGKVKAAEAKEFADELAGEEGKGAESGTISIPRSEGALIVSLRTEDGKNVTEIPEGTKKIFLHSELKGTESASLKVVYNGPGAGPDEMKKLGESRIHLAQDKPTEETQVNPAGGSFAPGNYQVDLFLKDEKVGAIPFKVTPVANKP